MKVQSRIQAAFTGSNPCFWCVPEQASESLPAPANPALWPPSGGRQAQDEFLLPGINGGSHKNPTCRGLDLTEQTKLSPLTPTVCPNRAHWISDLSSLWQRAEPVDRWRSSSPSSANYFSPGPMVPVKKPSMLSVTLSPLYHLSFPPSLCSFHPFLSLLTLCRRERTLYYFDSVSIYLSSVIFLHLCTPHPHPSSTVLSLSLSLGSCGVS